MVGWALSGGGNLGALEVGAALALAEAGILPDMVAGASAGALNSVGIAMEPTLEGIRRLEGLWRSAATEKYFPGFPLRWIWNILRGRPPAALDPIAVQLEAVLPEGTKRFSDLAIPCWVSATELQTGKPYYLGGDLEIVPSVLASIALPGVFPPVELAGKLLIDGGVTANVPVQRLVDAGATVVIAVTLRYDEFGIRVKGVPILRPLIDIYWAMRLMMAQILRDAIAYARRRGATVIHFGLPVPIAPPLWDFSATEELIEFGYRWTKEKLKKGMEVEACSAMR